jgi:hypothetical protein
LDADAPTRRKAPVAAPVRWRAAIAVAVALCAALGGTRGALADDERELQVEAAFLVNFVRYTDWPPGRLGPPGAPYVVSVLGSEDDARDVADVASAAGTIGGRRIEVQRVDPDRLSRSAAKVRRLQASHVVFVRADSGVRCATVRSLLGGAPVLTVGDATGCAATGGMFGLVRVDRHLAFEANPDEIHAAGLAVSAKVLKLARIRRSVP